MFVGISTRFVLLFTLTVTLAACGFEAQAQPATADSIPEYCSDPTAYATVAGVPDFLAGRTCGWLADGADPDELLAAFTEIPEGENPGSPAWVGAFSKVGDRYLEQAEAAVADEAGAAYLRASFYYFLARFPHVLSPEATEAYRKHQDAYLKASAFFEPALDVIRIPFEGKEIVGHLRVPKAAAGERPPLVIVSGGIDVWKSELEIHTNIVEPLLARGLATFSVDVPGTGESAWLTEPGSFRIHRAVVDHLQTRSDVDGSRLGFYGLSFGGYYAAALAATEPDLRAVVNVGGPVHYTFIPEWCPQVPVGTLVTLARTMGLEFMELGPEAFCARMAPLSLANQGVLKGSPDQPALLSINGARDELVTIKDVAALSEYGLTQDTLVFADDGHVAGANSATHRPFSFGWLEGRLKR